MEITRFIQTPVVLLPNIDATVDAPLPVDIPVEAQTVSSLTQLLDRSVNALNRSLATLLRGPFNAKSLEGMTTESVAQLIPELLEQIHAKRDRSHLWAQRVRQCCAVMSHCMKSTLLDESRLRQLNDEQGEILRSLKQTVDQDTPFEIAEALAAGINSSNDFFEKLLELIDLIKNGYLAGYEHIIKAYTDFFADFNAAITAKMKDWIEGANDGKDVKVNVDALRDALTTLLEKYTHPNSESVLFPDPDSGGTSKEEAEKWLKALGLPVSCLKKNPPPGSGWCVVIDTSPLTTMISGLASYSGTVTWDTAKYNQWQTGFNAQEERLKNMLQSLTQKYSNANSYHDNFNKTLSAHLNQFADMLRAMLNF
ncbi:IpaD/SipD/SspD family type III secretion system needle tip protein [Pseudomonas sp. G2-4]|uniref:IpaD/SipD/SspD family type III secretion system needle tip protein n=1 Tax=Pseudomonas sp. G2-4 TaxID=1506334 RepID=UPI0024BAB0FD|nr:IpaD/SipD/SspD family type III secretion system needle tip protein [Pseudomonas sp. G2-4]WHS62128.1 IpaD/SipD/SspD family type III secretion system needle tip protein [Pseudomonas sp. G2-4]